MKYSINFSLLFLGLFLLACQEDDLRVKYSYSLPTISNAFVQETEIMYGDSITLNVGEITDNATPLSTLEVKVVVNDVVVAKESIRTKGNSVASVQGKYHVPFGPYMPDNADVEVYLSAINVEGNAKTEIISNTLAKRPDIQTLNLVMTAGGSATKLSFTDKENYIYTAENLSFGSEITFYLAEKVTRFGNVDWTGLVWGNVNGELGLIEQGGDGFKLSDLTLIGFKSIKVDLFNFTVSGDGEKLTPITEMNIDSFGDVSLNSTNHLGEATTETWKKAQLYLGNDTEFTINGIANVAAGVSPDFFEVTGTNKVKFLGETGVYTIYYLPSADYLYIEQPAALYPDALWLDGVGFGRPFAPYTKTSSWNWNSPLEYIFCRKVSAGVFQATIYVEHQVDTSDDAWRYKFSAKFFGQRGWGEEIDAREYAISTSLLTAPTEEDQGNFVGTAALANASGVYRFTIDTNAKKITFEKIN